MQQTVLFPFLLLTTIFIFHGDASYLICKCENLSICDKDVCVADLNENERCFSTRKRRGCTTFPHCLYFADKGYGLNKTFMICCRGDTFCNVNIDQTQIDEYVPQLHGDYDINVTNQRKRQDKDSKIQDPNNAVSGNGTLDNEEITLIIVFMPCTVILLCTAIWMTVRILTKKQASRLTRRPSETESLNQFPIEVSVMSNSGSGMGVALLNQKTLAWQIVLEEEIGSGAFGLVRRGIWNGQDVAVKIMDSNEQDLWELEKGLYMTKMLSHNSILGFIGADVKEDSCSIQRWIVFDFHAKGSVYDYLQCHVLDVAAMLKMVTSFVEGLHHLHAEIHGSAASKPSIAHRDIKTKNLLVKRDGTCCIADFGLAHKRKPKNTQGDYPPPYARAGTVRYQAPELLDGSINATHFDAFRKVDIYAFGLCVWEICKRTEIDDHQEEYELPYLNEVPCNPGQAEMRPVVCIQQKRPEFPIHWNNSEVMQGLKKLLEECWYTNPFARLPILRIRKTLNAINQNYSTSSEFS